MVSLDFHVRQPGSHLGSRILLLLLLGSLLVTTWRDRVQQPRKEALLGSAFLVLLLLLVSLLVDLFLDRDLFRRGLGSGGTGGGSVLGDGLWSRGGSLQIDRRRPSQFRVAMHDFRKLRTHLGGSSGLSSNKRKDEQETTYQR